MHKNLENYGLAIEMIRRIENMLAVRGLEHNEILRYHKDAEDEDDDDSGKMCYQQGLQKDDSIVDLYWCLFDTNTDLEVQFELTLADNAELICCRTFKLNCKLSEMECSVLYDIEVGLDEDTSKIASPMGDDLAKSMHNLQLGVVSKISPQLYWNLITFLMDIYLKYQPL